MVFVLYIWGGSARATAGTGDETLVGCGWKSMQPAGPGVCFGTTCPGLKSYVLVMVGANRLEAAVRFNGGTNGREKLSRGEA